MQEVGLGQVCANIDQAFKANDLKRVDTLLWSALDQFSELPQLWFYAGNLFFQMGRCALSVLAFERCLELEENPLVYANLGAAYRRLNNHEAGLNVLKLALDKAPDYEPALVNLGSMYVNEGKPAEGIPYLERAVAIGREKGRLERGALWNLGLLYLEAGRFAEGFDIYRQGLGAERMTRSYGAEKHGLPEPKVLEPADSGQGKTLIVYGEQGIGDELMFGTCIGDAREEFAEVIFECHPRLMKLHEIAHPGMRIFATRKEDYIEWPIEHKVKADYKCPIGDLAARYRREIPSFDAAWKRRGATYKADKREAEEYRALLKRAAQGRPVVALAIHGGVMQTARTYRTLRSPEVDYLISNTNAMFVGIDYDDMTELALYLIEKHGPDRYIWYPSIAQHWDYDHLGALMAACDLTVSVCQSAAHLSAGMGLKTRVLTPQRCAWRYAKLPEKPEQWFFYPDPDIRLYRQDDPTSWKGPLERVIADIKELQ